MDQETKEVWWDLTTWTSETRTVVVAICAAICLVAKVALASREDSPPVQDVIPRR